MKRLLLAVMMVCGSVVPAFAQLTPAPFVLQAYYDNNGQPYDSAGICVYQAGTSTLASSYTTAAGGTANANPLMLSSAGRPSSNGFFLVPGSSYKLVLVDFTNALGTPTCSPINGSTVWTQDNIQAVPGSSSAVDIEATAGESIAAGDAVFISNGSNSLNAGQFYRTDSDLIYKSTAATLVGIAPNAISSGATGSIRIAGAVDVPGPLLPGFPYFADATPGAIVATVPTNAIRIGTADTSTSLIVGYTAAPVGPRGPPCGRLTLTSGVPVTTADVTAAATLYYTPYGGCDTVSTFNGTQWEESRFTQLSIAAPAGSNQMYDVFIYDNAGALALELTAWTNDTTRATALTTQNGVYVKTGVLTRLYLGSVRTVTASQLNDSFALRHVWNYYNRVDSGMRVLPTGTWTWTTNTFQQANNSAANQLSVVIGVAEDAFHAWLISASSNPTTGVPRFTSIGFDAVNAPATGATVNWMESGTANEVIMGSAEITNIPSAGYHFYAWIERSIASGTTTWYGTSSPLQTGIFGLGKR